MGFIHFYTLIKQQNLIFYILHSILSKTKSDASNCGSLLRMKIDILTGLLLYIGSLNFSSVYRNFTLSFASFAVSVIRPSSSRHVYIKKYIYTDWKVLKFS